MKQMNGGIKWLKLKTLFAAIVICLKLYTRMKKMKHKLKTVINKFDGEYSFLSNFFPNDLPWNTNEHFYQAMKAKDIKDTTDIFDSITPNIAKKRGRKAELKDNWNEIKDHVMIVGLWIKFSNNAELRNKLLATGNAELIEENYWHDNYWGNCTCSKCENIKGENKLGKLLMIIRDIMKTMFEVAEYET
jgi:ribA/ribD-fused uncharacterized protein